MNKKQMDYQNGYITQKYDRINVTLPKGKKDIYRKHAESKGMSLNSLINNLLESDMAAGNQSEAATEKTENPEKQRFSDEDGIEKLELSVRTFNYLCREDIRTVGKLREQLDTLEDKAPKAYKEIIAALTEQD